MSVDRVTFEVINAYVDSELDAADAAVVARAGAEDPKVAHQVTVLGRLKSAVADSGEGAASALPQRSRWPRQATALAACVAFLVVVGSLVAWALLPWSLPWLEAAWQRHDGWSAAGVVAQASPAVLLADYGEMLPGAYVPDLSAAGLTLVHAESRPRNDDLLLVGYVGSRGCKVSLLVAPAGSGLGEALADHVEGLKLAYTWRSASLRYVILAEGMDGARFRLIAETVRRSSRQHTPADQETQVALKTSRAESRPCLA